jgi:hypothetical protein
MSITKYLEKYVKNRDKRQLSKMNDRGLEAIIASSDINILNSMEDLFGNLFTNFQTLFLHLENSNLTEEQRDALIEEVSKNISQLLTLKEYFTNAKKNLSIG